MSAGAIIAGFQRARALLRKKLSGMINGIVIGDALGGPFKDIPPGQKLTFQGKELEYIDRFYHYNIGYQNNWPPETTLALYSFEAFIHIHQKDMPVKEAIHGPLLKSLFQCDKRPRLVGSGPVNSQFMRLAPLAVFACRCKLNTVQTITVALLISTRDWFKVFPAIELLLLIKSIFEEQELIPDVLIKMAFAAKRGGYKDQFDRYLKARSMALEKITPGSDLWVWKHITESILGFSPGERWADVQAFENGVLRVVNGSYVRDRAGAIAGALLGALGRDDLPFRFYTNIIGDIHLTGLTDRFLKEFFSWGGSKRYTVKQPNPQKASPAVDTNRRPKLRYVSTQKIGCYFYTIVVKNESLRKKYPGGYKSFSNTHQPICNDFISVDWDMGDDTYKIVLDLKKHNFEPGTDYITFDAARHQMGLDWNNIPENTPVDLGVDWLSAEINAEKGFRVWFTREI